ncbi:hypothetical protein ACWGS9_15435 [Bradyrhizobium sp. Arg314]
MAKKDQADPKKQAPKPKAAGVAGSGASLKSEKDARAQKQHVKK